MFGTQSVAVSPKSTAHTARQRLLNDKSMRRHHASPPPHPSHTATIDHPTRALTPAEQEQQAIAVAKSFKQHYLSSITYHDDQQLAIASIKPIDSHDLTQEIHVDADGNVDILSHGTLPTQTRRLWRVLLVLSVLVLFTFLILV